MRFPALLACLLLLVAAGSQTAPAGSASPNTPAHLELEITLEPATHQLQAVATLVAPEDFTFVLHESLAVRAVTTDGKPVAARVGGEHGNLQTWLVPAAPGVKLRIRYGGTLPALDRRVNARDVLQTMPPMSSARGSYLPAGSYWYPRRRNGLRTRSGLCCRPISVAWCPDA